MLWALADSAFGYEEGNALLCVKEVSLSVNVSMEMLQMGVLCEWPSFQPSIRLPVAYLVKSAGPKL